MLVLTRKMSQRIMIGDSIVITVVRVDRDRVRLGIEAPRELAVIREELLPERSIERRQVAAAARSS